MASLTEVYEKGVGAGNVGTRTFGSVGFSSDLGLNSASYGDSTRNHQDLRVFVVFHKLCESISALREQLSTLRAIRGELFRQQSLVLFREAAAVSSDEKDTLRETLRLFDEARCIQCVVLPNLSLRLRRLNRALCQEVGSGIDRLNKTIAPLLVSPQCHVDEHLESAWLGRCTAEEQEYSAVTFEGLREPSQIDAYRVRHEPLCAGSTAEEREYHRNTLNWLHSENQERKEALKLLETVKSDRLQEEQYLTLAQDSEAGVTSQLAKIEEILQRMLKHTGFTTSPPILNAMVEQLSPPLRHLSDAFSIVKQFSTDWGLSTDFRMVDTFDIHVDVEDQAGSMAGVPGNKAEPLIVAVHIHPSKHPDISVFNGSEWSPPKWFSLRIVFRFYKAINLIATEVQLLDSNPTHDTKFSNLWANPLASIYPDDNGTFCWEGAHDTSLLDIAVSTRTSHIFKWAQILGNLRTDANHQPPTGSALPTWLDAKDLVTRLLTRAVYLNLTASYLEQLGNEPQGVTTYDSLKRIAASYNTGPQTLKFTSAEPGELYGLRLRTHLEFGDVRIDANISLPILEGPGVFEVEAHPSESLNTVNLLQFLNFGFRDKHPDVSCHLLFPLQMYLFRNELGNYINDIEEIPPRS